MEQSRTPSSEKQRKRSSSRSSKSESRTKPKDRKSRSRSRSISNDRKKSRYMSDDKFGGRKQSSKPFRKIRYNIPMLDGPLVNFRQFMELQTDRVDTHKAETHYQYYKKHWEKRQNEIFVKEHMEEAWFKEKYDPIISEEIQKDRLSECKKTAEKFFEDYKNNVFNSICLEITENKIQEIKSVENNEEDQEENDKQTGVAHQKIYLSENFDVTQSPYFGFDPVVRTLFIKTIPKELGRQDIYEIIQKIPGFQSLSLSEPVPNQQFQRYGWITFETEEQCNYAAERFKSDCLVINKYEFNIVKNNQKRMIKVAQKVDLKKSQTDFEQIIKLIAKFDQSKNITGNPLVELSPENFSFKNLDICLLYLRRIHSYCYYSGVHCNDERMLTSKCGSTHLRLKSDNPNEEWELPNWQNKVQDLANQKIIELEQIKDQLKGVALFKERLASKITYKVQKQMKNENGAWPCFYCSKKFKGSEFVVKHIDNKHSNEEKYQQELNKIRSATTLELYSNDKNKITHQAPQSKEGQHFQNFMNRNKKFNGGFNKDKKYNQKRNFNNNHQFKDLDEPETGNDTQISNNTAGAINYLEI
ncbi:hypothetical protein ABPG72_002903 [Tetrahymena utriculariae]